ncbi:vitamin B6 photo-protection and homoeostasis-domain-containing protein [Jimgerdemannia flammicorona]|uniref:Vitamin B6 photo-protection and homoeostasis-domain-containing protein n=1 Tax=Jimgerdemannia flammicorona TaxID=994334 RepID=A0A433A214_9FUNG|nr:vitamin B6 photo-protection and homoeostasis-domain-containing protein [Jimgerdemannia flammicorona]
MNTLLPLRHSPSIRLRLFTRFFNHGLWRPSSTRVITVRQKARAVWHPQWNVVHVASPVHPNDKIATIDTSPAPAEPSAEAISSPGLLTFLSDLRLNVVAAFLPKGYPHSVSSHYKGFVAWQFMHNVAGSVTGVLATQSLLFAIGLGAGSIPLAASLNWIIKDGLGQLGGVVYASSVSDHFDSEPKRYRFQATLAMQLACVIELMTPLFPGMFLLLASVTNEFIGGMMQPRTSPGLRRRRRGKDRLRMRSVLLFMCTVTNQRPLLHSDPLNRAHMHKTFALRNNLGDITGKSGSQSTAAGLVGTALGVVVSSFITAFTTSTSTLSADPTHPLLPVLLAFLPFSLLNIYGIYRSNLHVTTCSLNPPRAEAVLAPLLLPITTGLTISTVAHKIHTAIPTPEFVSANEQFATQYRSPFAVPIAIEPPIVAYANEPALRRALEHGGEYFIVPVLGEAMLPSSWNPFRPHRIRGTHVALWFSERAGPQDVLRGFYHATMVRHEIECAREDERWAEEIVVRTRGVVEGTFGGLAEEMERRGWEMDCAFLTDGDGGRLRVAKGV